MSGRCRSCNCILSEDEMTYKWPGTETYSDLCFECISKSELDEPDDPMDIELISLELMEEP